MLIKKFLPWWVLILIVLLGTYLRMADLGVKPNGLYVDEASTGYNAWSIALTSKDEYSRSFPLVFRFLGSYTPPLYTYLTAGMVHFMGLSVISVRLISAFSGILMILVIFIFARSLNLFKSKWVALLAGLFFAINPWSLFYSRIGYEIHLAFLLYSLGVLFLWFGLKNPRWLILGMGFLSLSTNAYHAERLLAHLTLLVFLILFRKNLFKKEYESPTAEAVVSSHTSLGEDHLRRENMYPRLKSWYSVLYDRKNLILGFMIYGLFLIPQLLIFFTPANTSRGFGLLYHLAPVDFMREFLSQYLSYFSPRNLFFYPDSDLQRSLPELSTFYPWMVIPYLTGLVVLIKKWAQNAHKFLIMLLLLAPIPAALTGDPFSTQRALPLLLPALLIIVLGLDKFLGWKFKSTLLIVVILSIVSGIYLYRSYAVLLPNERAKIWGYGFEKLADEIKKRPNQKFVIDESRIKPAYITLAFYLKYPPEKLQQEVDPNVKKRYYQNIPWSNYYNFGQIETRSIDFEKDIYIKQILVGDEFAISENQAGEHFLTKVFEIKSPMDEIIFVGFQTDPIKKCQNKINDERCKNE